MSKCKLNKEGYLVTQLCRCLQWKWI